MTNDLDIQIPDIQRVVSSKPLPQLDDVAKDVEHLVSFHGVVFVEADAENWRVPGSMVVSSCLAFISPRPLKRLICTPLLEISRMRKGFPEWKTVELD